MKKTDPCPFCEPVGIDDCTVDDFLHGMCQSEEALIEMAMSSPECHKGIINPTIELKMSCDKCSFEENIANMKKYKGYEKLVAYME